MGGGCLLIWKEIYKWAAGEWVLPSYLLLFKDIPCIVEMNWKYIWRKIVDALPFTKYPCQSPNNDPCSLSVIPKSNIAGGVNTGQTFELHFRIICAHHSDHTQTCNKSWRKRFCHKRSTWQQQIISFSTQGSGKVLVYVKKVLVLDKTGNSRGWLQST